MNYEKVDSIIKGHPTIKGDPTVKGHPTYSFLMWFFRPRNTENSKPDKTFSAECKHGLH